MTSRFTFLSSLLSSSLSGSTLSAALLVLAFGSPAHAEKADRAKPMNIEADAMRYDDLNQTSVFTGNVLATKGTIIVRGNRIDVRQDADGYQYGVVTAEPGKLAYFKQKRDAPGDEWIEGEGEVIEYDSRADNVKFIRRAVMRRLLGATVNDESSGPVIVYDQAKDTFTVNGALMAPGASATTAVNGRVKALLTPRAATARASASGASAAASDGKSGSPAVVPPPPAGTPLRQSTTLGGEPSK